MGRLEENINKEVGRGRSVTFQVIVGQNEAPHPVRLYWNSSLLGDTPAGC